MKLRMLMSLVSLMLVLSAGVASGVTLKGGVFGGYTAGGDVEENKPAYGGHLVCEVNETLSFELAVLHTTDESETRDTEDGSTLILLEDLDVTSVNLLGRVSLPVSEKWKVYAGLGVGYYMLDIDADAEVDLGPSAADLPGLDMTIAVDEDVDDEVALTLSFGTEFKLLENLELFAEYRYAFINLDIEGQATATARFEGEEFSSEWQGEDDADYDLGVFLLGLDYRF